MQIILKQNPSNEIFVVATKCLQSPEGAGLGSAGTRGLTAPAAQRPSLAHLCVAHHLAPTEWEGVLPFKNYLPVDSQQVDFSEIVLQ